MITFNAVSKSFRIYQRPSDWLREKIFRRPFHKTKRAVKNVSFTIQRGEVFGIIGQNGAGKSTILKLIMGVLLPDSGSIRLDGRVTGLLELGSGFNHQFSGYDNIAFNGALLGMTPDEIAAKRADIIAFSELEEAIHNPLRTYSSGMAMRLGFAVAIHANPACLVVDEALSVGDIRFQQKCFRRLEDFKAAGGSILFVSHDLNAVKLLCDRALVMDRGEGVLIGTPQEAVQHYYRIIARMDDDEHVLAAPAVTDEPETSYGTGEVEIVAGTLVGQRSGRNVVASGELAEVVITARAHRTVENITVGILIRDRFGQDIFGTNTHCFERTISMTTGTVSSFVFAMPMAIAPGQYTVTAAIHREDTHMTDCHHWCDSLVQFEVVGFTGPRFVGVCNPGVKFELRSPQNV